MMYEVYGFYSVLNKGPGDPDPDSVMFFFPIQQMLILVEPTDSEYAARFLLIYRT